MRYLFWWVDLDFKHGEIVYGGTPLKLQLNTEILIVQQQQERTLKKFMLFLSLLYHSGLDM